MTAHRLDALSRSVADRASRRQALVRLGRGGFGAGLLAAVGLARTAPATARQDDDEAPEPRVPEGIDCTFRFAAHILVGPGSERENEQRIGGELSTRIFADGRIAGRFVPDDDDEVEVQGQATGHSVALHFPFGGRGTLVAVGAGPAPFADCTEDFSGPASGPALDEIGRWEASPVLDESEHRGCPETDILCDAGCEAPFVQTIECSCVTIGTAVCDAECDEGETLSDDCECVCLL